MKLEKIDRIKRNLAFNKSVLKKNLTCARSDSKFKGVYRTAAKEGVNAIHSDLFTLRAVEKQIPMPMVVKVIYGIHHLSDGTIKQYVFKDNFCPCCGNHIIGVGTPKHRVEQYCYQCGQKLWWPSC